MNLQGVMRSPDNPEKVSAGRFALISALVSLVIVYIFVGWRIGFTDQAWTDWEGFVNSFRDGMGFLGLGGYGINKGRAAIVDSKKASAAQPTT